MTRPQHTRRSALHRALPLLSLVLLLGGCGADPKPFDYHPVSEIQQGPGLFTGETGAYEVEVTRREVEEDLGAAAPGPPEDSLPRPAHRPPYTSGVDTAPVP